MTTARIRSGAAAALFLALLAGCGGSGTEPSGSAPSAPAPPAPAPKQGAVPRTGDGSGGVRLTKLGDFVQPLYVAQPPGDSRDLFVVEKEGAVRVLHDGRLQPRPFLDLGGQVTTGLEQGLLSIAFAPDYERSGRFYVDYTDRDGNTRVVEYRRSRSDPLQADPGSARPVLGVHQPASNHNGGQLQFGPDGLLYIGLGDGGFENDPNRVGQKLSTPLAKILRVDPRPQRGRGYRVPASNPFAGRRGAVPETYAYGLRNPWRFSFDRKTGALSIGDVGQSQFEEVDIVPAGQGRGANFGWSAFEGPVRFNRDQSAPGAVPPVLAYSHAGGGCSVTGGYVVRDPALRTLYGRYLYGDFCLGQLRSFVPAGGGARGDRALGPTVPSLSSFGEDSSDHIYVASLEGPVYRIDPK